jgi:hypothetical protein
MELKDSVKNRKVSTVPLPYQKSLTYEQIFQEDTIDYKLIQKFLKREGRLSKILYLEIIKKATHIFSNSHFTI